MGTFKHYLQSKGQSQKSIETHQKNMYNFLDWADQEQIESDQVTYNEMMSYIQYLKRRKTKASQPIKQRTIQVYIGSLQHYFRWLIAAQIRKDNPIENIVIKGVKRKYLYDILNKQELETLYHTYPQISEQDPNKNQNWFKTSVLTSARNKAILGLMIWQGLNAKDLAAIEVKDLKLREGKIEIHRSRKSNERTLKLESHQILDLMEYKLTTREEILKQTQKESNQLFISTGKSDGFNNVMGKLMEKLKAKNPRIKSAKQIRTSVITGWLKRYNLREVQYMAGHRYISSTESYLVNDIEGLKEDITKYHPI